MKNLPGHKSFSEKYFFAGFGVERFVMHLRAFQQMRNMKNIVFAGQQKNIYLCLLFNKREIEGYDEKYLVDFRYICFDDICL